MSKEGTNGSSEEADYDDVLLSNPHMLFFSTGQTQQPRDILDYDVSQLHKELAIAPLRRDRVQIEATEPSLLVHLLWRGQTFLCINNHLPYSSQRVDLCTGIFVPLQAIQCAQPDHQHVDCLGMGTNSVPWTQLSDACARSY